MFTQNQLGTASSPAVYELDITAPGYRDRRIQVSISPDTSGLLYNAVLRELDDQMLATPGGFSLVANSVSLPEVFGLLGNLPMFASHPLAVTKTVDRDVASGGDRLFYTLQVGASGASLGATKVVDTLPGGVVYAPGTARVDNVPVEPLRYGRTLTWAFPSLSSGHTITYACVVMPYAAEGATLVNVVDVDAVGASGAHVTGFASADTRVVAGPLGNRIVITGRVFADVHGSGRYSEGDHGVAGVRIFLEDGESVTTDKYGRFTFPSVHPGQHVLRIDESTLPAGGAAVRRPPLRQPEEHAAAGARAVRLGADAGRQLRAAGVALMLRARIRRTGIALVIAGMFMSTVDVNPAGEIRGALAATEPIAAPSSDPSPDASAQAEATASPAPVAIEQNAAPEPSKAPEAGDLTHLTFTATGELSASLVAPADDSVAPATTTSFEVETVRGAGVELKVGDAVVPFSRIGKRAVDNKSGATRYTYYGVVLAPGPNVVSLTPLGAAGARGVTSAHHVYGPGRPATLAITASGPLRADGGSEDLLHLDGVDRWGHHAAAGSVVRLTLISGDARLERVKDGPREASETPAPLPTASAAPDPQLPA